MVVTVVKEPRAALSISIQVSTRHTRPRQGDVSTRHAMHADWCMRFVSTMIMINAGVLRRFQAAWMMIDSCPSGSGAMPDLFQSFHAGPERIFACNLRMPQFVYHACILCMHTLQAVWGRTGCNVVRRLLPSHHGHREARPHLQGSQPLRQTRLPI